MLYNDLMAQSMLDKTGREPSIEEVVEKYDRAKKIEDILYNFRNQKRASRLYSQNLEQKLEESWNSGSKISKDDYNHIIQSISKYFKNVDENDSNLVSELGEHLSSEISLLSELGLTKNQISKAIRKKDIYRRNCKRLRAAI